MTVAFPADNAPNVAQNIATWHRIVEEMRVTKANAASHRTMAQNGTLTPRFVWGWVRQLITFRARWNADGSVPQLQAYARQSTGNATLSLTTEFDGVLAALTELRQAIVALPARGITGDDSAVSETPWTAQESSDFIAACTSLIAALD